MISVRGFDYPAELITAPEVREGDILFLSGRRLKAVNVSLAAGVARYELRSCPTAAYPFLLPARYEGMVSGGNELALVAREIKE